MARRKKRLKKQIKGLLRQAEKHQEKIETGQGRKDTTPLYWEEEKKRYEQQAEERAEILEKIEKRKRKE